MVLMGQNEQEFSFLHREGTRQRSIYYVYMNGVYRGRWFYYLNMSAMESLLCITPAYS